MCFDGVEFASWSLGHNDLMMMNVEDWLSGNNIKQESGKGYKQQLVKDAQVLMYIPGTENTMFLSADAVKELKHKCQIKPGAGYSDQLEDS